jgi:lipopolysaccharide/colanic/teichoic acid biosynthesis glycosyltransferase
MSVDEWVLSPTRPARTARIPAQPFHVEVTVPHKAMWFVDAARRPSLRPSERITQIDLDRRTTTVLVPARSEHPIHDLSKRAVDLVAATLLVVLLLPLLLAIAVFIASTSRGGAFFVQRRVGLNGKLFPMLKFRSMVADADTRVDALMNSNEGSGPLFKLRSDPRVTAAGRFLRRTSLDELPQLLNVILGHMSLVGPRPALPREVDQYTARERRRLQVKPGITGLWQVCGRSDLSWEDSVRLDLLYVDHWSLRADVKILARTAVTLVRSQGAY